MGADNDTDVLHYEDMPELSERDRAIIAFESAWTHHGGDKEVRIRTMFGISPARYYQLLNAALDEPAALEADSVNVNRLRKLRDERRRSRATRSFGA